jgi:hypothetical protein
MPHPVRSSLLVLALAAVPWAAQGATPFHVSGTFSGTTWADYAYWTEPRPPLSYYQGAPATGTFDIFVPAPVHHPVADPDDRSYWVNGAGGYLSMTFDIRGEHFEVFQGTPSEPWAFPSIILLSDYGTTTQTVNFMTDFMPKYGGGSASITGPQGSLFDDHDATTLRARAGDPLTFHFGFVSSELGYRFGFDNLDVRWAAVAAPVPEPATAALLLVGLALVGAARRAGRPAP